jgi:hypothetical protein
MARLTGNVHRAVGTLRLTKGLADERIVGVAVYLILALPSRLAQSRLGGAAWKKVESCNGTHPVLPCRSHR